MTYYPVILLFIFISTEINNKLKVKYGYKLELQTFKTMKLFGSTKKLTDKTKNRKYT